MNQFFKDFLQPLNQFIFIKSAKDKLSAEYDVYKKSIKEIMEMHKKLELNETINAPCNSLAKKKQESSGFIKVIGEKMIESLTKFENLQTGFESINLKTIAESYLSIKNVLSNMREKNSQIANKNLEKLNKLKTNKHTVDLIEKFTYGNI